VRIDWKPIDSDICTASTGVIVLNPISETSPGISRQIQYIDSVVAYQLWDDDVKHLLYNDDGTATPRLKFIAESIQKAAPIMWDEFIWDEGYWDVVEDSMNGINYIPNIWDADVESWRLLQTSTGTIESKPVGVYDYTRYDSGVVFL
jgi:hypothetical protein